MERRKSVKETLIQASGCFTGKGIYVVLWTTALMILLGGLWIAKDSGRTTDLQMRRDLVRQAIDMAATVNPLNLRALSFTADDKDRPEFQRLSSQLRAYAAVANVKSLYTMALRNGQIVFGPESLAEGHPQASPPGTVYEKPTRKDWDIFSTGSPQIQGPRSNEYGTFVSATAPVFDPRSGEVLAVVGIDVDAAKWRAKVLWAQWIPALITMLLLLILLLSGWMLTYRRLHSPQTNERRRYMEPVLCFIFMLLLTLILAGFFDRAERRERKEVFYQLAHTYAAARAEEFYDLREEIDQLGFFFESSQDVNRNEFSTYCEPLLQHGILEACVWLPAVPSAEVETFIQTVRTDGHPDFSIWQKNSAGAMVPASLRPVYYPALYIAPSAGRERGLGYDLNSESVRRAAMQEALRTGLPTATDLVKLIALTNSPPGFFIFAAVDAPIQKGLVAFVVRPENLLGGAQLQNKRNRGLNACLVQLRPGEEPLYVVGSHSSCGMACFDKADPSLRVMVPVFRFGKAYALRLIPDKSWLAANPLQYGRLAGLLGLMVTILITSLVWLITNRRAALERLVDLRTAELQESEEKQRCLLQHLPVGIVVHASDSSVLFANETAMHLLGLSLEQMQGRVAADPAWRLVREDGSPLPVDEYPVSRVLTTGRPAQSMFIGIDRHVDASRAWVLVNAFPRLDAAGQISQVVVTFTDITDRKAAEVALINSEDRFRVLFDQAPLGYQSLDENGCFIEVNAAWLNTLGYQRDEVLGKWFGDFLAPEFVEAFRNRFPQFKATGKIHSEFQMIHKNGTRRFIALDGRIGHNPDGSFKQTHCILSDITEIKQMTLYSEMEREMLEKLNEPMSLHDSITCVLGMIKEKAGVDAVGIRLQEGDDFPYFVQDGFSADFLLTENTLTERGADGGVCRDENGHIRLECTCGLVLSGKTDPANPFFTKGGSFWTNDSFPLLDIPADQDPRLHPRNECIHQGYASIALVPIRSKNQIVGLLQLTDRRKGRFSLAAIEQLESVALHIGAALLRKQAEEELNQRCEELELFHDVTVGRELRMIELKKEINALMKTIGQPEKYTIVGEDE
jgi:PAS domain S-box-containing protein